MRAPIDRSRHARRWTCGGVALLVAVVAWPATHAGVATAQDPGAQLLPDLNQALPRGLNVKQVVRAGRTRVRLGFDSAASNTGHGPLLVHGTRRSRTQRLMRADQLVRTVDGRLQITKGVGHLRFVKLHDHRHWHFLDFERYELRDDRSLELVTRDNKSGFCLGDRYRVQLKLNVPGRVLEQQYGDNCAPDEPNILGIFEGISPGWGDRYLAFLEGQHIDITRLHSGTYQLVHRVNPESLLIESNRANNAATVRLQITWPRGRRSAPTLRALATCANDFGCAGAWAPGARPIPSDLQGTPFGAALAG